MFRGFTYWLVLWAAFSADLFGRPDTPSPSDHVLADSSRAKSETNTSAPSPERRPAENLKGVFESLTEWDRSAILLKPSDVSDFMFFGPNEWNGFVFEPCVAQTEGILLAVGSFRALNLAANTPGVVQLDIDPKMRLYNLVNAQLIALAKNRYEYLSLLFTGKRNERDVANAMRDNLSPFAFREALLSKAHSGELGANWKALGIQLTSTDDWKYLDGSMGERSRAEYWVHGSELKNYLYVDSLNGTRNRSIFGNDRYFSKIRNLVLEGNVKIVQANLYSKDDLKKLGERLAARKLSVGAVDISNVLDYVFRTGESPAKKFGELEDALNALPLDKNACLLFTNQATGPYGEGAHPEYVKLRKQDKRLLDQRPWLYYAVPFLKLNELKSLFPSTAPATVGEQNEQSNAYKNTLIKKFIPNSTGKDLPTLLRTLPANGDLP